MGDRSVDALYQVVEVPSCAQFVGCYSHERALDFVIIFLTSFVLFGSYWVISVAPFPNSPASSSVISL